MKKYLVYALITAVLAVHTAAFAQDEAAPQTPAKTEGKAKPEGKGKTEGKDKAPKTPMFMGEITAIDAAAATLTVKGATDQTKNFKCADDCKILTAEKKKNATIADLKVGDKVMVQYAEEAGTLVAKMIKPAKAKPAEAPKKKKNQTAE